MMIESVWMTLLACVIGAAVVMFVVAALARRTGWPAAIFIGFSVLVVVVLGLYFASSDHRVEVERVTAGEDPWPMHAQWSADHYPSRARAVEALAVHVVRELRDGVASCESLRVVGDGGDTVAALRRRNALLEIEATEDSAAGADATSALLVLRHSEGSVEGDLEYVPVGGDRVHTTLRKAYVDAPWVLEDPATQGDRHEVLVGRSGPQRNRGEAKTAAEASALDRLADRVRVGLATNARDWEARGQRFDAMLHPIAVANDWRVDNVFVQTFDTDHGQLRRVAVHSAPIDVAKIRDDVARHLQARRQTWAFQGVALLVLAGLTYLGYWVLDSSTRGHFTWRLRAGSLVTFVAAVVIVMLFVA